MATHSAEGCSPCGSTVTHEAMDRVMEVEGVLDIVRPAMEADGGGVDLVGIVDGRVEVKLRGMCLDCPSASLTLRRGIEGVLKERLHWVTEVRRIG